MNLLLIRAMVFFEYNVSSATSSGENSGGFAGGWFGEEFKKAFVGFCNWCMTGLFNTLSPFVIWGCKTIIIWCILVMYCTQDKRSLSLGLKTLLIYVVFLMIRSVIV